MSNVNDNNLDDLLKRAAERYPLRTDSADWERLVSDLDKDPSLVLPPVTTEDRRRRRRFFWLFFLLPLAGGAWYAWHAVSGEASHTGIAREKLSVTPVTARTAGDGAGGNTAVGKDEHATKGNVPVGNIAAEKKENGSTGNPASGNTAVGKDKGDVTGNLAIGKNTAVGKDKHDVTGNLAIGKNENGGGNGPGKDIVAKNEHTIAGEKSKPAGEITAITARPNTTPINRKNMPMGRFGAEGQTESIPTANASAETSPRKTGGKVQLAATKGAVVVNIPVRSNTVSTANESPAKKDKIKVQKPKHSFYVGILGSPDISLIKFQSVKSVGANFGLLFGYTLNSKWSIETGLYYDRKKYYTDGEYFSKSKVPALNYVDLKTVNGVCNMWEIPLNVRYNFSSGGKMKWFATGGLSTYLMSKEVYTFKGTNQWGNPMNGTWPYKTPYHYFFSIVNFSVGFEQPLGKIGNLRLEPFVRVPLSGIGTGSLSIMSAGLNIGITRRIW